jgi:hypothetical protein
MEDRDKMRIATLASFFGTQVKHATAAVTKKIHSSDGLRRRLVPFRASQTLVGYKGSTRRRQRRLMGLSARQRRIQKRAATGLTDKIQARRYVRIMARLFGYGPGCQVREHHNGGRPLTHAEERFMEHYGAGGHTALVPYQEKENVNAKKFVDGNGRGKSRS